MLFKMCDLHNENFKRGTPINQVFPFLKYKMYTFIREVTLALFWKEP
ncbi:hypothetical protein JOD43_001108 [Pullulanibacillus pueri]|nr:hypothetical protein [Pullulanibacillus pueri]